MNRNQNAFEVTAPELSDLHKGQKDRRRLNRERGKDRDRRKRERDWF